MSLSGSVVELWSMPSLVDTDCCNCILWLSIGFDVENGFGAMNAFVPRKMKVPFRNKVHPSNDRNSFILGIVMTV